MNIIICLYWAYPSCRRRICFSLTLSLKRFIRTVSGDRLAMILQLVVVSTLAVAAKARELD